MSFDAGEVVIVPFPFTDSATTKRRPAVVLSSTAALGRATAQSVLAMVTSARQSRWPLDVEIDDLARAGLPSPCVVRMKLFTLDQRLILRRAGMLSAPERKKVAVAVSVLFAGLDLRSAGEIE